jgi:hypothetical protein
VVFAVCAGDKFLERHLGGAGGLAQTAWNFINDRFVDVHNARGLQAGNLRAGTEVECSHDCMTNIYV